MRGAWRLAYDNRGAQPRVVEGPHAVDLRRRTHGSPCRAEQCPLDLPLPGLGPAPSGGLTTNSRRTGLTEGTIYWHLKQIYQKLPISRQVDLVRLVLSIAEFG